MYTLLFTIFFLINCRCLSDLPNLDSFLWEDAGKETEARNKPDLLDSLVDITPNESRQILTIHDLINLEKTGVLNMEQAVSIWKYINKIGGRKENGSPSPENGKEIPDILIRKVNEEYAKAAQQTSKKEKVEPENKPKNDKKTGKLATEGKSPDAEIMEQASNNLGFYQLMLIIGVGFVISFIILTLFVIYLYERENYMILVLALSFLGYNILFLAQSLQDTLEANFFSSIIYNTLYIMWLVSFHVILIKIRVHTKVVYWSEMYDFSHNFKGKMFFSAACAYAGYALCFYCKSPFVQIPFYSSSSFLMYGFLLRIGNSFPGFLQPFWNLTMSFCSLLILFYFNYFGKESLKFPNLIDNSLTNFFLGPLNHDRLAYLDFRYLGFLGATFILTMIFPVYLYIQKVGAGSTYKTPEFNYWQIYKFLKLDMAQERLYFNFNFESLFYYIYAITLMFLIVFGLRNNLFLTVVLAIFSYQSLLGLINKDNRIFWMIIFYVKGFFLLNSTFLLGKIEDSFALQILSDFKDGYAISFLGICVKLILYYYSMEVCNYNTLYKSQTENNTEKSDGFGDLLIYMGRFFIIYIFAVYLLAMAEEEASYVLSLVCILFALMTFSRLILYSTLTRDEINKFLIGISLYLVGMRLTLLTGKLNAPLYFGSFLSNFSVFGCYNSLRSFNYYIYIIIFFVGLLIQATIINSSVLMLISISNFSLFLAWFSKNKHDTIVRFSILMGIHIFIIICGQFTMNPYFWATDYFILKLLPIKLVKYLYVLMDQSELPEQILSKFILTNFQKYVMGY